MRQEDLARHRIDPQFLFQFTDERVTGAFARFELSSGEFPLQGYRTLRLRWHASTRPPDRMIPPHALHAGKYTENGVEMEEDGG